MLIDFHCA